LAENWWEDTVEDVQTLMEWEAVASWGKNEGEGSTVALR